MISFPVSIRSFFREIIKFPITVHCFLIQVHSFLFNNIYFFIQIQMCSFSFCKKKAFALPRAAVLEQAVRLVGPQVLLAHMLSSFPKRTPTSCQVQPGPWPAQNYIKQYCFSFWSHLLIWCCLFWRWGRRNRVDAAGIFRNQSLVYHKLPSGTEMSHIRSKNSTP